MNTSLIQFLREMIQSSRRRHAIAVIIASLLPVVAAIALLVTSEISVWAIGFGAAAAAVLLGVARLIVLDEELEMRRGLTIAQVIASSGFALLRSEKEEELPASRIEARGHKEHRVRQMELELPEIRLHRELEAQRELRQREREDRCLHDQKHLSWSRLKAALHSSGFSEIRGGLSDKDRTGIG